MYSEPSPALHALLHTLAPLAIAFSGGLDSRFLAHTAVKAGLPVHLLHISDPHVPREGACAALAWPRLSALSAVICTGS